MPTYSASASYPAYTYYSDHSGVAGDSQLVGAHAAVGAAIRGLCIVDGDATRARHRDALAAGRGAVGEDPGEGGLRVSQHRAREHQGVVQEEVHRGEGRGHDGRDCSRREWAQLASGTGRALCECARTFYVGMTTSLPLTQCIFLRKFSLYGSDLHHHKHKLPFHVNCIANPAISVSTCSSSNAAISLR